MKTRICKTLHRNSVLMGIIACLFSLTFHVSAEDRVQLRGYVGARTVDCLNPEHHHHAPEFFLEDDATGERVKLVGYDRQLRKLHPRQKVSIRGRRIGQTTKKSTSGDIEPIEIQQLDILPLKEESSEQAPVARDANSLTMLSTLLVFISTNTHGCMTSETNARNRLFNNTNNANLGMQAITKGRYGLQLGNGTGVPDDHTINLLLNVNSADHDSRSIESQALGKLFGSVASGGMGLNRLDWNRILLFAPGGIRDSGFTAYAYYPSGAYTTSGLVSIYGGSYGNNRMNGYLHELGHNFGFDHSAKGSSEYGDRTCVMGLSNSGTRTETYNVVKLMQTNWLDAFPDAKKSITADTTLDLYPLSSDPNVMSGTIAVNFSGTDYYAAYHRNQEPYGYLSQTNDRDKVFVYFQDYVESVQVANLAVGGSYTGPGKVKFERYGPNNEYATVSFDLNDGNAKPVANTQTVSLESNLSKAITLTGSDADNNPLTYSIVSPPSNGTLSGVEPNLTYSPNVGYLGTDSFVFKVHDGKISSFATVNITVRASVIYNGNGNTGGTAPMDSNSPYLSGATVTVLGNTGSLVKTGYGFTGWNTAADGSGTHYSPGATFAIANSTTLHAMWISQTLILNIPASSVAEAAGTTSATVSRSGTTGNLLVNLSSSDTSEITVPESVTILDGQTFTIFNINVIADSVIDTPQSVTITASAPGFITGSDTILVTDSDNIPPTIDAGPDQSVFMAKTYWNPASVDPLAWYDATDTSSITHTAGAVSQWADKANTNHMMQTTGTQQPLTGTTQINGLNSIAFDGMNDTLKTATNPFGFTIDNAMVMGIYNIGTFRSSSLFSLSGSMTAANRWHSHSPWSNGVLYFDCGGTSGANRISKAPGWSANQTKLLGFYCSVTDNVQQAWVNGSLFASDSSGHSVATSSGMVLGSGDGASLYSNCRIGEVFVLNGTVSTENRQKLEGYLAHKWGFATNLPAAHPYKNSAPNNTLAILNLEGTASDANGQSLTHTWSVVSGPASVSLANANSLQTTATFTLAGTYLLRLTSHDGYVESNDHITITVNQPLPSNFALWADGAFSSPFTSITPNDNPDGDPHSNLLEFAFGTDPTRPDGGALASDGTAHGSPVPLPNPTGGFDLYFMRRVDHSSPDSVVYTVQFSDNLDGFTDSTVIPTVVTASRINSAYEVVKVPFPPSAKFGRIRVEATP